MVGQKQFNWRSLFERHPVFSSLKEKEIERLLRKDASSERDFPQGHVILTEGEVARSCFLIGSGSVRIIVRGPNGRETTLSVLRRGEIFGEMALIEKRSRAKTVLAMENCILLEIAGERFLNLLEQHPDIESKVLLMLSERLRHTSDQLLEMQTKGVDERFQLFNTKLDAELKAFDAILKAAQAIMEQTRLKTEESLKAVRAFLDQAESRTKEVTESAEQSRARLIKYGSAIGGVIVTVISLIGFLGVSEYLNVSHRSVDVEKHLLLVQKASAEADTAAERAEETAEKAKKTAGEAERNTAQAREWLAKLEEHRTNIQTDVDELNRIIRSTRERVVTYVLMPGFCEHVRKKSQADAMHVYEELQKIHPQGVNILLLLNLIEDAMTTQSSMGPGDFTALLCRILEDTREHKDRITCLYLILVNAILVGKVDRRLASGESYEAIKSRFVSCVAELKGQKIVEKRELDDLENFFHELDPEKRKLFERVKELIPIES